MLLSAITTVYNCERFIAEALQSLINQSFQDFELIIVNDGSTDHTWDIVSNTQFSFPIKLVNNSDNKKIPTRRNEAIKIADGKYIAICDGDDISLPKRFAKQINYLENNADIDFIGGHAVKIDESGKELGMMSYPPEDNKRIINSILLINHMNPLIDPTMMFKRATFNDLGGYALRTDIYTAPDFNLWCRALLSGCQFYNLQEPIIKYRESISGMTQSKKREMIRSHVIVRREFLEQYNKKQAEKFFARKII